VAAALLAIYGSWLLLRDAPLFAVQKVAVVGLHGPQAPTIRTTLEDSARGMTTTHLDLSRLRAAVASFAVVRDVRARTEFPHGVRIQVIEELPVAALVAAGQRLPVAADGKIVRGIGSAPDVAAIAVDQLPGGSRISDPLSIEAVELLDIAPPVLRARVAQVTDGAAHGLTAALRGGPALYFGDTTRLHAKWAAVARVLADPASRGAVYLDVHAPDHPAAQVGDPQTSVAAARAPGTAAGALVTGAAPGG
jgi:cell division protein FtsQ